MKALESTRLQAACTSHDASMAMKTVGIMIVMILLARVTLIINYTIHPSASVCLHVCINSCIRRSIVSLRNPSSVTINTPIFEGFCPETLVLQS